MKKLLTIGAVVFFVFAVAVTPRALSYIERQRKIAELGRVHIPPPSSASSSTVPASSLASSFSARSVNLDVPFTPQAPLANWDELHGEACEEASVLMAVRYFQKKPIGLPEDADIAIMELVANNTALGFPVDDTAEEVAVLIRHEDPSLTAVVWEDPTVDQMTEALLAGKLVIVPAAGRQLGNPFYTAPGPVYHMLVIKGFTEDGYFITNDPGTKRGKDYVYRFDVLMNAIHDWNGGKVETGARRVIVVSR